MSQTLRNNLLGHFQDDLEQSVIDSLFDLFERPPAGMVIQKYGSRSLVGSYHLAHSHYVLKYYHKRGLHHLINYKLSKTRALQAWEGANILHSHKISVAQPIALIEETKHALPARSLLVLQHVEGTPLDQFVKNSNSTASELENVVSTLRHYFTVMYEHKITHGDLKANNILVSESLTPYFIDFDGTQQHTKDSSFLKNWEADKRRFLKNWQTSPETAEVFHDVFDKT